jgi:hypothetical protein
MSLRLFILLAVLAAPALAQPPVPPPVDGPIAGLPPLDLGPPGVAVPPRNFQPFPTDGNDPGLEGWSIGGPGSYPTAWLVNFDLDIIKPQVKNQIAVTPGIPVVFNYDDLLSSSLDWTVAPRLEVGYRLPDGQGAFLFGYRYLASEGNETAPGIDVRSRLSTSTFDFLYQTERVRPFDNWYFHARIGARILSSFYDTRNVDGALTQSASSTFFGGGILGAFDVEYAFDSIQGLALYGNAEGAVVLGEVEQNFHGHLGGFSESATQRGTQAAQMIAFQAGLSYAPPQMPNLRLRAAYQYENWFNVGKLHNSNLEISGHSLLLRAEFVY